MTTASAQHRATQPSKGINIGLWIVQSLLALTFAGTGIWKLATPIPELAAKMPWMGQVSPSFLYATAVFDILGGLGVLSPAVGFEHPAPAWFTVPFPRHIRGARDRLPCPSRPLHERFAFALPTRRGTRLEGAGPRRPRVD